jgi:hypothetical protein
VHPLVVIRTTFLFPYLISSLLQILSFAGHIPFSLFLLDIPGRLSRSYLTRFQNTASDCLLLVAVDGLAYSLTLKMEAVRSSEMSASLYQYFKLLIFSYCYISVIQFLSNIVMKYERSVPLKFSVEIGLGNSDRIQSKKAI